MNRLTASEGANWNQTYVYDNVGNRAVLNSSSILVSDNTPQTGSTTSVPFDAGNHWSSTVADYDGAGNLKKFNKLSAIVQTLSYDAEERMTAWTATISLGTTNVTFTYDGDGRRVTKTTSAGTTVYVYDPAGNLAAEYGGPSPTVGGTLYMTQDHLGSTRLVTTPVAGQPQPVGCHDYLPFGEEIPASWGRTTVPCYAQTAETPIKFTGQERDAETGLDNFLARHMAGAQGRFLSPDPIGNFVADPGNPQSWNLYSYVMNNPLAFVDPSGTCTVVDGQYQEDGGDPCPPPPNTTITVTEEAPPPVPYDDCTLCETMMGAGGPNLTNLPMTNRGMLPQSYWGCIASGTDYFSLQNGLRAIAGKRIGDNWLAGAFLGNSVQSAGDTIQALANGAVGKAANAAGSEAFGDTAGGLAKTAASRVPNISIAIGVQAAVSAQTANSAVSTSISAELSAYLPTGVLARAGANALSRALETLGAFKLPYDLAVAGFSAVVCGIGR